VSQSTYLVNSWCIHAAGYDCTEPVLDLLQLFPAPILLIQSMRKWGIVVVVDGFEMIMMMMRTSSTSDVYVNAILHFPADVVLVDDNEAADVVRLSADAWILSIDG
jgi:hypothetical protein